MNVESSTIAPVRPSVTGDESERVSFVLRWYELWNDNDKAGWLAHWRNMAPGEPQIEDPVGKPVKRGWAMVEELWDRTGRDHFKVGIVRILDCVDEVAVICRTNGTYGGIDFGIDSVDVHQFRGDSLAIRSYWEIPANLPYGEWTAVTGEPA